MGYVSWRKRGVLTLVGCLPAVWLVACEPKPTVEPPTLEAPAPPPPPSGSFLAQLAPDQTAQLNQLGVEVVVPGVVPPGFRVAATAMDDAGYTIAYRNDQSRCFGVEFSRNPADSPAMAQAIPVSPPLFSEGDYALNFELPADSPRGLASDWLLGSQGAYRLVGSPSLNAFEGLSDCQNVDPEMAVEIIESFTIISPDIVGDGESP